MFLLQYLGQMGDALCNSGFIHCAVSKRQPRFPWGPNRVAVKVFDGNTCLGCPTHDVANFDVISELRRTVNSCRCRNGFEHLRQGSTSAMRTASFLEL